MASNPRTFPANILVRGGGDLASGVILRLARAKVRVWVSELPQPMAVRRLVSFAQAVYSGEHSIEGVMGRRVADAAEANRCMELGIVPVVVDLSGESENDLASLVCIDARMTKLPPDPITSQAELLIGLGPGFAAGQNCHAVIETKRGPYLGRVIWEGTAEPDTGQPEMVAEYMMERVLRAPADGFLEARVEIGTMVHEGQVIADVGGKPVIAPFSGTVRGLIYPGIQVQRGLKIGDLDPRLDGRLPFLVSDKALAVGGGVMEAILTRPEIRRRLWE